MRYGATAYGQITLRNNNIAAGSRQPFASSPVNVIDSIVITKESDPSNILAEWIAYEPSITIYRNLTGLESEMYFQRSKKPYSLLLMTTWSFKER